MICESHLRVVPFKVLRESGNAHVERSVSLLDALLLGIQDEATARDNSSRRTEEQARRGVSYAHCRTVRYVWENVPTQYIEGERDSKTPSLFL